MLKLISDITLVKRFDLPIASNGCSVVASGYQGMWVTKDATGHAYDLVTPTLLAYPVWTESNKDGTVGWSGDVSATGNITVLFGKFQAITDKYVAANMALGAALTVSSGLLKVAAGSEPVVAVCTKVIGSATYGNLTSTFIEFDKL